MAITTNWEDLTPRERAMMMATAMRHPLIPPTHLTPPPMRPLFSEHWRGNSGFGGGGGGGGWGGGGGSGTGMTVLASAHNDGFHTALATFKNAGWIDAIKNFGIGQGRGLNAMLQGGRGMMQYDPMAQALGKGIFMQGAKKALPTMGALALGGLALRGGPQEEQQLPPMPQRYPGYY